MTNDERPLPSAIDKVGGPGLAGYEANGGYAGVRSALSTMAQADMAVLVKEVVKKRLFSTHSSALRYFREDFERHIRIDGWAPSSRQ